MARQGSGGGRREVEGALGRAFGRENVFRTLGEWQAAEEARRAEARAEARRRRRQFEYELAVLKLVAEGEGLAAAAAAAEGDAEGAYASAFRAWHVARLVERGERLGQPVWALDVVGRCLLEAGLRVPATFVSAAEVREMIEEARRRAALGG